MSWKLLSFAVLALSTDFVLASSKHIVCYYGTWATYRWGLGKFDVETINPWLCTHLVYTFVGIQQDGNVISLDPYLDLPDNYGRDNLRKFNALKLLNPELKTLLAVGGWNEGSAKYSTMAANPTYRANFIRSALRFIFDYGFDGFDLDWEYPNQRDSIHGQADVENFSQLLRELRSAFDKHQLLLTAAVAAVEPSASLSYNVTSLCKNLDIVNLMTYDLAGSWDGITGHNAGLYKNFGAGFSVSSAVDYWLEQGCSPLKLALGVPFYGRTFTLINPDVNEVSAPTSGPGIAGPFTATSGSVGYNEFCNMQQTQQWEVRRDEVAKVPYAIQGKNWVTFDDVRSITAKVEYAVQKNLGGIMIWSIETDDFNGVCGEPFPLLKAINIALDKTVDWTTTSSPVEETTTLTEGPTTENWEPSTTEAAAETTEAEYTTAEEVAVTTEGPTETEAPNNVCMTEGITADPENCDKFYICIRDVNGELKPMQFRCSANLHFDKEELMCNYPELVKC